MSRLQLPEVIRLGGVTLGPSQAWGGVRLVPVLRDDAPGDLRLGSRKFNDDLMVVSLDGELMDEGIKYMSYVPHGLVVRWTDDGLPAGSFGTELKASEGKTLKSLPGVRIAHRMAKREGKNQLRILPLHLAMEGFLALHFGGPEIAWSEYSKQAISRGLDPRWEDAVPGRWILGLRDALRVFEIHDNQVGSLVFVADSLASAFVVSHPSDYRRLHRSLLQDFYGELLYQYSLFAAPSHMKAKIDDSRVKTVNDLTAALDQLRAEWEEIHGLMADGLINRPVKSERVYRAGPFQLIRFCTELVASEENHIGEGILREDGSVEYLKTYRLSAAQTRRAYLLSRLAAYNWNIDATAAAERQTRPDLIRRLEKAGFGYLLKEEVLHEARRRKRKRS